MDAAKKLTNDLHGSPKRQFGQINIDRKHARELSKTLVFVEDCIVKNRRDLALMVTEELNRFYRDSPSLLIKILLRELADYLKYPDKKARQMLTLNSLNMMLNARLLIS